MSWLAKLLRRNWPIKVHVFKRYENTIKIVEGKGRRVKEKVVLEDGESYHDYFEFFTYDDPKNVRRIPTQGIAHAKNIDGTTVLYLYQVDLDTFYPMKVSDKGLSIVIENDDGTEEKIVFDPNLMIDGDSAVKIPFFVAEKTYDKDSWLSQQIVLAQELFRRKKGFFEKYGHYMVSVFSIAVIFLLTVYAIRSMSNMFEDTNKALLKASENFEKSSRYFEVIGKIIDERYQQKQGNTNPNPTPQPQENIPPP